MNRRTRRVLLSGVILAAGLLVFRAPLRIGTVAAIQRVKGRSTVAERVAQHGEAARARLAPAFAAAGSAYPPRRVTLVGLKAERRLEVWVADEGGAWRHVRDYPVLGASGTLGPKLRQGDRQVPEGVYGVEALNPNSSFHLSLRLDYPNADDLRRAREADIADPGSDIMIHGNTCSIGCLAMGDGAAEDLFVLAAETGLANIKVILSPVDFRVRDLPENLPALPAWVADRYSSLRRELALLVP